MSKDAKRPSARVGDVVESTSFCGVNVSVKLTERCTHVDGFFGTLVSKDDIVKLVNHGVPYNIKLDAPEDISVIVFDFQIVKKVSQKRKRRRKVRKRV